MHQLSEKDGSMLAFFQRTLLLKICFLLIGIPTLSTLARADKTIPELQSEIQQTLEAAPARFSDRMQNPNQPTAELGTLVEELLAFLQTNPDYEAKAKRSRTFNALLIQTINHLQHVSFSFEKEVDSYTHRFVLTDRYPVQPTLKALEKVSEFFKFTESQQNPLKLRFVAENKEKEKELVADQQRTAREITKNSIEKYKEYRQRLVSDGPNASFPEFRSMVEYLLLKMLSDPELIQYCTDDLILRQFREVAMDHLEEVLVRDLPYIDTVEAVERALEFYDVYHRMKDPTRSPVLYHSGRYEYYGHYLKSTIPDHIMMPTLAFLGATDLLKTRGVPISFIGVSTDITWVDGYYQTPFEFYVHDINHSRRMFLFFQKMAEKHGWTILETAERSDTFVKNVLIPLISIHPSDNDAVTNKKRLIKVLLFEVLHEDALAALPEVIEEAILRKAGVLTPFERIEQKGTGKKVVYEMQPGASTLAYVFRKLVHDFYDMPEDRMDNIVDPEYRTYPHILEAATELLRALGVSFDPSYVQSLLEQDTGFPEAFENTTIVDVLKRPKGAAALISSERAKKLAMEVYQRSPLVSAEVDENREVEIVNFFRDGNRIKVHLKIPVKDDRKYVQVKVDVPEEKYGVHTALGTAEQFRGERRIIEIQSGKHLSIQSLKDDFLSRLPADQCLVAIRADDSESGAILAAAQEYGLTTLMLIDVTQPRASTQYSPSYFAPFPNRSRMNRFWNDLIVEESSDTSNPHFRLDFNRPLTTPLTQLRTRLEQERLGIQRALEDKLVSKGIGLIRLEEVGSRIAKDKIPISFAGAARSWDKMLGLQQEKIQKTIERTLDMLDPSRVVLMTGGTDLGVDKVVQHAAAARGFTIVGALAESANAEELGPITYGAIVSRTWYGKSRPVLKHVQMNKGVSFFFPGGPITGAEETMAREMGVEHYVMRDAEESRPGIDFKDADELIGRLYAKHPEAVKAAYRLNARDSLFYTFSRQIEKRGASPLSYSELVSAAKGLKVVFLGGYVDLGYAHPERVREALVELMRTEGDNALYVGVGTMAGIGEAYHWIPKISKQLGFKNIKTAAIVSRNVANRDIAAMDYIHFVNTDTHEWKPFVDGEFVPNRFCRDTNGRLVFMGGGGITGEVAKDALESGLPVEIHLGPAVAPDPQRVSAALARRPDTVIDGLSPLARKRSSNLSIVRSKKLSCRGNLDGPLAKK